MQLTRVATYGVIVLQELYNADGPVSAPKLAEVLSEAAKTDVTPLYVQQVLRGLQMDGIVSSFRGEAGGYVLTNKRRQVSVYDVIRATSRAKEQEEVSARNRSRADVVADRVDNHVKSALKELKVKDLT
jgi:Rrf2 family protein